MDIENMRISGSDHFQLLLDHRMRNYGQAGNISRIQYLLSPGSDLSDLRTTLRSNPVFKAVLGVGLNSSFFGVSRWKKLNSSPDMAVALHSKPVGEHGLSELLNAPINLNEGFVRVDLYQDLSHEKYVLISMHHVLFDHRGMMNFIRGINGIQQSDSLVAIVEDGKMISTLKEAFSAVLFAFKSSGSNLISLADKTRKIGANSVYKVIRFSEEETQLIQKNAIAQGAVLSKSVLYMAAAMMAVSKVSEGRKTNGDFVWLAAPHNLRRKGVPGHLIGNAISFLYFRLNKDKTGTAGLAVANLQIQLKDMIKQKIAKKQDSFLKLCRRVPLPIYQAMTDMASGGKVASLAFSDLSEQPDPILEFCGCGIQETSYFPPVPVPPGLSVVFNKENGKLAITVGLIEGLLNEQETRLFVRELKRNLLGVT